MGKPRPYMGVDEIIHKTHAFQCPICGRERRGLIEAVILQKAIEKWSRLCRGRLKRVMEFLLGLIILQEETSWLPEWFLLHRMDSSNGFDSEGPPFFFSYYYSGSKLE